MIMTDNEKYPNLDYCAKCYNYDTENNSCGALFGPEITTSGKGKEHCIRYDYDRYKKR